ncbi:MAG: LamG domain-containing protein, partial [Pirellulales bacterium]
MSPDHRRDFLKAAAAGLAGASLLPALSAGVAATPEFEAAPSIPPHEPLLLPGVHAYAQRSLAAGDTLQVRVSSTAPYELQFCQLGLRVDDPAGDAILEKITQTQPAQQAIHPGSYIHVEKRLDTDRPLAALTIDVWVRPWRIAGTPQAIVSQLDLEQPGGFALWLDEQGRLRFWVGSAADPPDFAEAIQTAPLAANRWHHVAATFAGQTAALWLDGVKVSGHPWPGPVQPAAAPLRIGAWGRGGAATGFLDADIAMPALYERALSGTEIAARFKAQGREAPGRDGLLAAWLLSEERGELV